MSKIDAKQKVLADLLAMVQETGEMPWQRKWDNLMHQNLTTKHVYTGFNAIWLSFVAQHKGWSNYWLTFDAGKKMGHYVAKGSKSVSILRPATRTWYEEDENGEKVKRQAFTGNFFYKAMFNASQFPTLEIPVAEERNHNPVEEAEKLAENYVASTGIKLVSGTDGAWYCPSTDTVGIPALQSFHGVSEYYCTLFHELVHSTGADNRLNRGVRGRSSGIEAYSREELVAEIGGNMLCSVVGVEPTIDNSAAYLKGWLKRLTDDADAIFFASSQAQKAVEMVQEPEKVLAELKKKAEKKAA